MAATLYDKVWNAHAVAEEADGTTLLYVDRHLVQEVSSPQAFAALAAARRAVRRPAATLAVADHAVPTRGRDAAMPDGLARRQLQRLEENARAFHVPYIPLSDRRHGIVHVIGPELGFTLPGSTLVCGDSHTCTHGALGALAFGIGASEVEQVLATQCLRQRRDKRMRITLAGSIPHGLTVKDMALALIAQIGIGGGAGHAIEYSGPAVSGLSMAARMTLCNMTIEAGSRVGMIAPDDTTFAWLLDRPMAPRGALRDDAILAWRALATDPDAVFDREVTLDVATVAPHVTWGTTPEESVSVTGRVPDPADEADAARAARMRRSLAYMALTPGQEIQAIGIDRAFIGSCTNGRIEDLRDAARVAAGRQVAKGVSAIVVPGSAAVRAQAEAEGLDRIFRAAGFEWREAGCSMCVAMNEDRLAPGQRCASTSNRNFEGRQGVGGRTHLMSPAMVAAAAVTGHLVDARRLAS